jgi:hypothetical protein
MVKIKDSRIVLIHSPFSRRTCLRRMADATVGWPGWFSAKPLTGSVHKESFWIQQNIHLAGRFRVAFVGDVGDEDSGSCIRGEFRLFPFYWAYYRLWVAVILVMALLFGTYTFITTRNAATAIAVIAFSIVASGLIALAALGIFRLGIESAFGQDDFIVEFLCRLCKAKAYHTSQKPSSATIKRPPSRRTMVRRNTGKQQ